MIGLLAAYLVGAGLALWYAWYVVKISGPGDMMGVGLYGMALMGYLLLVVVVSGVCYAGSAESLLRCAGIHVVCIAAGTGIGLRHPVALLYGLAAGGLSLAASGTAVLVRVLFAG